MSDTTDPELSSLITNVWKPPKNFDFPESEQLYRFVWFEEFPWKIEPITCLVLFVDTNVAISLQKTISNMQPTVETFQKHHMFQRKHTKKTNFILKIFT